MEILTLRFAIAATLLTAGVTGVQDQSVKRPPSFPKFQADFEVIFEKEVVQGKIYYDSEDGWATISYNSQTSRMSFIYNIDEDVQIVVDNGKVATVETLINDAAESFVTYTEKDGRKVLPSGDEYLLYKNAEFFGRDTIDGVKLTKWHSTGVNISKFDSVCDLHHYFADPMAENLTCGDHFCQSVPVKIKADCNVSIPDVADRKVTATIFILQFKDYIENPEVFQPPPGTFFQEVKVKKEPELPRLPGYFSFYYDVYGKNKFAGEGGTQVDHSEIWYDRDMTLVRRDDFDLNYRLTKSTVFDNSTSIKYTIEKGSCAPEKLTGYESLEEMAKLPREMFPWQGKKRIEKVIWKIGKRKHADMLFDVWSVSAKNEEPAQGIVSEIYYLQDFREVKFSEFLPSYVRNYMYSLTEEGLINLLEETSYQQISNFKTRPRDWTAFDVVSCYQSQYKLRFELTLTGPDYKPNTKEELGFFQALEIRLLSTTQLSVVRLGEMQIEKTSPGNILVSAIIIDTPTVLGLGMYTREVRMKQAYDLLENSVKSGGFIVSVKETNDAQMKVENDYTATGVKKVPLDKVPGVQITKDLSYSGGDMAGIAIGMFIVGIVLGMVIFVLYFKCHNKGERLA